MSTGGWIPRATRRRSATASLAEAWARSRTSSTPAGSVRRRCLAIPRSIAMATRRCWGPSCRSRSMRRRSASTESMARSRVSVKVSTRALSSATRTAGSELMASRARATSTVPNTRARNGSTSSSSTPPTAIGSRSSSGTGRPTTTVSGGRNGARAPIAPVSSSTAISSPPVTPHRETRVRYSSARQGRGSSSTRRHSGRCGGRRSIGGTQAPRKTAMRHRSAPTMPNATASMIARNGRPTSRAPVSAVPRTDRTTARKTPASSRSRTRCTTAPQPRSQVRATVRRRPVGAGGAEVMARP